MFVFSYKILAIMEQKRAAWAAAAKAAPTHQNATAQPSSGAVAPINLPPNTMAPSSASILQASDKVSLELKFYLLYSDARV